MLLITLLSFLSLPSHAAEEMHTYRFAGKEARLVASALYNLDEKLCRHGDSHPDRVFDYTLESCEVHDLTCYANDSRAQLGEHPYEFVSNVMCLHRPENFSGGRWPETKSAEQAFALVLAFEGAGVKPTGPTDGYGPEGFRAAQQYEVKRIFCSMVANREQTCEVVTAPPIE